MKDLLYYYTKDTFRKTELGEIQSDFNMSFVMDGTKDSMKVICLGFVEEVIKPMTIVKHENTNTWWVVAKDDVDRFENDNGYFYKHTLQLVGAIELLNARDLTDCGFYQNRYTLFQIFQRLINLSTFEFKDTWEISSGELNLEKKVDYIKTFENYSLLSALTEIFDAYNSVIKLEFDEEIDYPTYGDNYDHIYIASFKVVSKSGRATTTPLDYDSFNKVIEKKNLDKNSYGTTVVSNCENVVSSITKTFPTSGGGKLTSNEYRICGDNAIFRLPSKIFKLNWLRLVVPAVFQSRIGGFQTVNVESLVVKDIFNKEEYDTAFQKIVDSATSIYGDFTQEEIELITNKINEQKTNIYETIKRGSQITLYTGWKYNAMNSVVIAPENNSDFYFVDVEYSANGIDSSYTGKWLIGTKEEAECLDNTYKGVVSYERGEYDIKHLVFVSPTSYTTTPYQNSYLTVNSYASTDLRDNTYDNGHYFIDFYIPIRGDERAIRVQVMLGASNDDERKIRIDRTRFIANYIPMSDLKIKYDNNSLSNDMQLYNQNGKVNDSVSLSKLMLSYSKEIVSDNIVKYGTYYKYQDIPEIGQIVVKNGVPYVINNVSIDFYQNEQSSENEKPYFFNCQFNMSRNVSTKSLLTSPNSNIRDYGIPQNNNVPRKQLYRDFYELGHTVDPLSSTDYYMPLSKIVDVDTFYQALVEHIAIMEITYAEEINGSDKYYYQLDTTTFVLKKAIYEVVEFKDNNIIGYDPQNSYSGFDVTRVLSNVFFNGTLIATNTVNTPVSYVDDNGEFVGIKLAFCKAEQYEEIYKNYVDYYVDYFSIPFLLKMPIQSGRVFTASEVFNGDDQAQTPYLGAKDRCDFLIEEDNYNKDALEVPVFEYSCQIDDSEDVIIGDNILDIQNDDEFYFYSYLLTPKGTINENNWETLELQNITRWEDGNTGQIKHECNNVVKMEYSQDNSKLLITLHYEETIFNGLVNDPYAGAYNRQDYSLPRDLSQIDWESYDLTIIRRKARSSDELEHLSNPQRDIRHTTNDLFMVIRNMKDATINLNAIELSINHYKIN